MYSTFNPQRTTIQNSQNPFPCDFNAALGTFFQTLAAVQRQQLDVASIEQAYNKALGELDEQWRDLQGLAQDGLGERVRIQLNNFMKDYAAQKALYQFLDGAASGWTLNPGTPGLQHAMTQKLVQKHTQLSSLLVQILTIGLRTREEAQVQSAYQIAETRMQHAEHSIEREFERNRDLHGLVMQMLGTFNEQAGQTPQVVLDAHDDARKSLEDARNSLALAMKGVQQVQDVFPLIMGPAIKLTESANDLVQSNNKHLQQQLPSYVEEGMVRADKRKRGGKLFWFFLTFAVLIGLPLVAFLLLHFL